MKNTKTMNSELRRLQKEYMKAKASHETVKQIEKEVKTKVLVENEFYTADHQEFNECKKRILSPDSDFRMSESNFIEYCKLCYNEYLKAGLNIPNYNTTPDYKTFKNLQKSENELLKIGIDVIVEKEHVNRKQFEKVADHWKLRDEMLDLILKLDLSI